MKIAYLSTASLNSGFAHSGAIFNMSKAMADNGADVTLILPNRRSFMGDFDIFDKRGLESNFRIVELPCIDIRAGSASFWLFQLRFWSFYISARAYCFFHRFDQYYSRDIVAGLLFWGLNLEAHAFPKRISIAHRVAFMAIRKVVVITEAIKERMISSGFLEKNILLARSGVDIENFVYGQPMSRNKLVDIVTGDAHIDSSNFIIGYIGSLTTFGMEKGVKTAIESLKYLDERFVLLIVGGWKEDIERYNKLATELGSRIRSRVTFIGTVPHERLIGYAETCDCFVAPFPDTEHYRLYMSPLKIIEYMASGRPIIASDLPTIRAVLKDGESAILIPPADAKTLASKIEYLEQHPDVAKRLAQVSSGLAQQYSWHERAKHVLTFLMQ